jgi:hypothetical protein
MATRMIRIERMITDQISVNLLNPRHSHAISEKFYFVYQK